MLQFLWGLTPAVRDLTGRDILPTYNYFRPYRKNDICRVHSDREACEHSLSLTLGYSDGQIWPFDVGQDPIDRRGDIVDDFTGKPFTSIAMQPGDAVLYRGVQYRHGRIEPNPNRWSAHLFLDWVDRDHPIPEPHLRRHGRSDQRQRPQVRSTSTSKFAAPTARPKNS